MSYIESNLDDDLDTSTLCQVANLSKYQFHRQCSLFFGLPVMNLVRILRLKRAVHQLVYRDNLQILEIALSNGFESHEDFSPSFKKYFGLTPSNFRQNPDWGKWHSNYRKVKELRDNTMTTRTDLQVTLKEFHRTTITVPEHRGCPSRIGSSIKRFINWRKRIELSPPESRTFNIIYNDPESVPPDQYKMDIGCIIDPSIEIEDKEIKKKMIPQGACAVIRHLGSDDYLGSAVNFLYQEWLEISGYTLRDFPLFFERIKFFPDSYESKAITDVYLPIE
ncbi:GyrI-like domain-containing protein [Microbulbifer sp. A4B17]|uniref:AraC family transcriptional regulator n=1 Tax=Microbulbifer sp. A4B17 TaxID=359370 RepID=UPI001EE03C14|nr:GyrI-like domain-containing protein [Microbulbifer sp. A4B17]